MTKNNATNPKRMVNKLNCNKIANPTNNRAAKNIKACNTEIFPEVMGRFLVLATLLSRFRSVISLMIQPLERMTNEPIKNKIVICRISRLKF